MFAVLASQLTGMFSLTRTYTVSTYLVIGVVCAYCAIATANHPEAAPKLSLLLLKQIGVAAIVMLIVLEIFVRGLV